MNKIRKNKYLFMQNFLKYSFVFVFAIMMIVPVTVKAVCPPDCIPDSTQSNTPDSTQSNTTTNIDAKIKNPLGGISTIPQLIEELLNIVITVGVPIVAIAIIYTGFLFVKAQGNAEQLKTAKQALVYTLVGAGLLLGAWVLANAIVGTVEQIRTETR